MTHCGAGGTSQTKYVWINRMSRIYLKRRRMWKKIRQNTDKKICYLNAWLKLEGSAESTGIFTELPRGSHSLPFRVFFSLNIKCLPRSSGRFDPRTMELWWAIFFFLPIFIFVLLVESIIFGHLLELSFITTSFDTKCSGELEKRFDSRNLQVSHQLKHIRLCQDGWAVLFRAPKVLSADSSKEQIYLRSSSGRRGYRNSCSSRCAALRADTRRSPPCEIKKTVKLQESKWCCGVAVLFSTEATRTRTAATAPIIMPVMVPELFVSESRESSVEELDDESVVSLALNSAKGKDHQRNSKNKLGARGIYLSSSYSLSVKRYDLASEL